MSHWRKFHLIHTILTNLDAVRYTHIFYLYSKLKHRVGIVYSLAIVFILMYRI